MPQILVTIAKVPDGDYEVQLNYETRPTKRELEILSAAFAGFAKKASANEQPEGG